MELFIPSLISKSFKNHVLLKKIFQTQLVWERHMVQSCLVINTYVRESRSAQLYQRDAVSAHECHCLKTDCGSALISASGPVCLDFVILQVLFWVTWTLSRQFPARKKLLKQPYKNVNGFQSSAYLLHTMEDSQKKECRR